VALLWVVGTAFGAEEIKGTSDEQLKQLTLPSPAAVSVALLPFSDNALVQRHVDQLRELLFAQFVPEGFAVVHPAVVGAVFSQDKKLEPGQPLRKDDAVRLGKRLGAQWAVYGQINQCEAYYKTSFFSTQRKCKVALQLNIVNTDTEELFFWQQRADVTGGGFFSAGLFGKGAAGLEQEGLFVCSNTILKRLFAVLPAHPQTEYKRENYPFLNKEAAAAAYKATPDKLEVALTQGQSLLCFGANKEAVEVLGKAVGAHGDSADAHCWHGVALLATGAPERALEEWRKAVTLDPAHQLAAAQIKLAGG